MTKKRKKQIKKRRRLIIILIIIIIFVVVKDNKKDEIINSISNKTNKSYLGNVTNDSDTEIKEEWQKLIVSYLDAYTDSLKNLKSRDVTSLFTDKNSEEAYLTQTIINLQVFHHSVQNNDMRLKKASYDIVYKKVSIKDNKITIEFLENDYYNFKYLNNITSKIYNIENTIIINKKDKDYKIDSIRVERGNYIIFTSILEDKFTKNDIDVLKTKYEKLIREESENNKRLLEEANTKEYIAKKECDNYYNRDKAINYSYNYIKDRNEYYLDYSSLGGNCANHASQAIHEGGVPMDYTGAYEWKYFSDELNENNTKKGRSSSWVSTYHFYEYAKNNKGYGLCAEVDVNLFYAEVGDVVHVGYKDGNIYSHTTIVSKVIKKNGKTIDILVNSNTSDLEDYPVMGYIYYNKRLIKILGYND